jgi:hypothetical protein
MIRVIVVLQDRGYITCSVLNRDMNLLKYFVMEEYV